MTIDAKLFAEAGAALFGTDWKAPMANLLGMDVRTVQRVATAANGGPDQRVSRTLAPEIAAHLRAFADDVQPRAESARRLIKLLDDS